MEVIMRICGKCLAEAVNDSCPVCGKNKFLKEACETDSIYVTSVSYLFSRMVEDLFTGLGIRYVRKGTLGSAVSLTIGDLNETYKYYVMYSDYQKAKECIQEINLEFTDDDINEYIDEDEE